MYYKITNKESEIYKALHDLRTLEQKIEKDNLDAICKKVELDFDRSLGQKGQQNFRRVTGYEGFEFKETENIDLRTWKIHPKYPTIYIPNRKTKLGREMYDFLEQGLKKSNFNHAVKLLEITDSDVFYFPFIEIVKDEMIIIWMSDKVEPTDEDFIEITKKEFDTHFELI